VVLDEISQLRERLIRAGTFHESRCRVFPRSIDVALEVLTRDRASRKHRERALFRAPWLRCQPGAERSLGTAKQNESRVGAELAEKRTSVLTRRIKGAVGAEVAPASPSPVRAHSHLGAAGQNGRKTRGRRLRTRLRSEDTR